MINKIKQLWADRPYIILSFSLFHWTFGIKGWANGDVGATFGPIIIVYSPR